MFRRLRQRYPALTILIGLALLTFPCWGGLGWMIAKKEYTQQYVWTDEDRAHEGEEGLPSDARKYRTLLKSYPTFDAATANPPDLPSNVGFFSKQFPNGEWVFGIETKSHQLFSKGGTVVVKDSRGQIRTFYGHVCDLGNTQYFADHCGSLQDFYDNIQQANLFREQFITP